MCSCSGVWRLCSTCQTSTKTLRGNEIESDVARVVSWNTLTNTIANCIHVSHYHDYSVLSPLGTVGLQYYCVGCYLDYLNEYSEIPLIPIWCN